MKGAGAVGVLALLPAELVRQVVTRTAEAAEPHYFLDAHQYATVQALCRRLIPGPTDDPTEKDPGALEANVIAYIDLFLGAFNIPAPTGPRIWGEGPFSGRAGPPPWPFAGTAQPDPYPDDFVRSAALSATDVLSWRTLLEGTRGLPERKWADVAAGGKYVGLQDQYVQGVKNLDAAAAQMLPTAKDFVSLNPIEQELLIARPDITTGFPSLVFQHACEGMYGAPEYGGNKDLVGWKYIGWPGDAQPRGYTAEQMLAPDTSAPISANDLKGFDIQELFAHLALGTPRDAKTPWKGRRGL
ncbi:MAG: gluconate 2-dehydrogenase subunit 3 family protein [Acidimicrobiia bacterium]|nr:gluconate 2-dehydrogenase subunit 3 family protein [Acidimicrobiia bacterium]